jgi:hypothetical protein
MEELYLAALSSGMGYNVGCGDGDERGYDDDGSESRAELERRAERQRERQERLKAKRQAKKRRAA